MDSEKKPSFKIRGSGLAGLVLARELGERGFCFNLTDTAIFPREKVCGGILQANSWDYLRTAFGLRAELAKPVQTLTHYWKGKLLTKMKIDPPMVFVRRFDLDQALRSFVLNRYSASMAEVDGSATEVDAAGASGEGGWLGFQASAPPVSELEMHYAEGIYAGLSPFDSARSHAALLVRKDTLDSPKALAQKVSRELGIRIEPPFKGTRLIRYGYSGKSLAVGDAMLTTHPFLGMGMRHAIESARLFAELAGRNQIPYYSEEHHRLFSKADRISRRLERLYDSPLRRVILGGGIWSAPLFKLLYQAIHRGNY